LDWDEIRSFQKRLYAAYRYQHNNTALSPDQFVAQGGGDCDDWAIMTVSMLQYWGIKAYVGSFFSPEDRAIGHAVALVSVSTVPSGFRSYHLADWTEYHTKQPLPDGDYVPIDYTAVGDTTNAMASSWVLTSACEAVRMYGEGW
jgi:transglutaminase-like putative cysteine protease